MAWRIITTRGDFLPFWIGGVMLVISLPAFLLLLLAPDADAGVIAMPLLVILGLGLIAGFSFIVVGIQINSTPGSRLYRLSHGRLLWH
jgi:hypothetical protein